MWETKIEFFLTTYPGNVSPDILSDIGMNIRPEIKLPNLRFDKD